MVTFTINGKVVESHASEDTPLLWVIRDEIGLKGTKFGCGIAMCGACTVHLDGQATRSCVLPIGAIAGKNITTIEGLNNEHPLQKTWVEEQVPQCGYCQSGQIMQAATLLAANPNPSEEEIVNHMNGNYCRCMAYKRIKTAIKRAADESQNVVNIFDPNAQDA
ncbi:(2Fe-2S)-binding protein [Pseudoalteromonas carrageenovora]|uniref:Isoquinoline 1-oxidoreductase subunit alpha n=1 Tax=Pseudoalteromonas carrageenovora IAM 12662 TaxID=1314868 RepID=A0A2K4XF83_PSEVC|nr:MULTISPECIES: (2Fe-2S)-binding protein [Pseudoalteromonas]KTF09823.1 (2Fe-2S)-binding protein [Pseudoalteromonas sp. H103]MBE0384613.1 isoquinoline 1-oxidoreductase, alpha subunit [Pseudoalteromonas carrageenovora IAM 12662]MDO6547262.1 (2Fe-2S)-binding protein [Pseudoalteromonas carrageenovora]MDO6635449.1 (2Fe-2S)-binding protein [Pseudoalteromonas carrageenovora]MDO6647530.1 (2Fe-2S)-binding protein [Pseudoalteromonas carrageenovora]